MQIRKQLLKCQVFKSAKIIICRVVMTIMEVYQCLLNALATKILKRNMKLQMFNNKLNSKIEQVYMRIIEDKNV